MLMVAFRSMGTLAFIVLKRLATQSPSCKIRKNTICRAFVGYGAESANDKVFTIRTVRLLSPYVQYVTAQFEQE